MTITKTNSALDALTYEAPFLIEKLLKEHIVETEAEGHALFMEVKRFIVLTQSEDTIIWDMYSLRIDEVWHQFILFTREYIDFCLRYFGKYVQHSPSNAPKPVTVPNGKPLTALSFENFKIRYQELFGKPLPPVWFDETSVTPQRRVVNYNANQLIVCDDNQGMVNLLDQTGTVLISVNEIARDAFDFIAKTGTFYVRELPGELTSEEKTAIVEILVKYKILRVAP